MANQETGEKVDAALGNALAWAAKAAEKASAARTADATLSQAWAAIAQAELMARILEQLQKAAVFRTQNR